MRQIKVTTAIALLDVFWPSFVEIDSKVFLSSAVETSRYSEDNLDQTGIEVFVNHTHMIDLFKHDAALHPTDKNDDRFYDQDHPDFLTLCEFGRTLAQMWFQKLQVDFPQYDFRVYYTQDDNPIVRFHRVRPNEPNWIDEKRYAEEIRLGKVIIYDTRKKSLTISGA
jgi:hypothetical protein